MENRDAKLEQLAHARQKAEHYTKRADALGKELGVEQTENADSRGKDNRTLGERLTGGSQGQVIDKGTDPEPSPARSGPVSKDQAPSKRLGEPEKQPGEDEHQGGTAKPGAVTTATSSSGKK
jgi:hypothetical protein